MTHSLNLFWNKQVGFLLDEIKLENVFQEHPYCALAANGLSVHRTRVEIDQNNPLKCVWLTATASNILVYKNTPNALQYLLTWMQLEVIETRPTRKDT